MAEKPTSSRTMQTTFGAPPGAFGGSKGDQSGTESLISTLMVPLNGLLTVTPSPAGLGIGASGENLGLSLLELGLGDDAAVLQVGELRELVGAAAADACGIAHVPAELLLLGLLLADAPFLHRAAPGDQVNQDTEERQDDDEDEPEGLGPSAQVLAAENVEDNPEEQEDPQHPEEEPQHRQECVEKRVLHPATIHGQERRNSERPHVAPSLR